MTSRTAISVHRRRLPFLRSAAVRALVSTLRTTTQVVVFSICGGSCSGKTTLAQYLRRRGIAKILPMDSYYKAIPQIPEYRLGIPLFDHPSAFDLPRLREDLASVRRGIPVHVPQYRYSLPRTGPSVSTLFRPARVTAVDGILSYCADLRDLIDFAVFLDRPADLRRASRIEKDTSERGVNAARSAEIYDLMACPLFDQAVLPQRSVARFIIQNS